MEARSMRTIRPRSGFIGWGLIEIWDYRELFFFFVWKDLKIRYRQAAIGIGWAVIQPLAAMVIFTVIFGKLAGISSEGVPYQVFVFPTLMLWTYFSNAITSSSNSLVLNSNLISKIYFPRLLLPLSACLVGLVDYFISSIILVAIMIYYGVSLSISILLIVVPLMLTMVLAAGIGSWLSAIYVRYRDVQYAVPFFIQLLLFMSPIIYPLSIVTGTIRELLTIANPLVGIMTAQRAVVIGNASVDWHLLGISALVTLTVFALGISYFKHHERQMADVI